MVLELFVMKVHLFVTFPSSVESYCRKLSMCIERAAHVANQNLEMSKPFPGNRYNTGQQHHHYVFKIVPVRGKPFYGYCPCEKVFLKTYMYAQLICSKLLIAGSYNPQHVTRIVALLRSGAIMQTKFAVYEVIFTNENYCSVYAGPYSILLANFC